VEQGEIVEDEEDNVLHPTIAPGPVPKEWLDERAAASTELSGRYSAVTSSDSVASRSWRLSLPKHRVVICRWTVKSCCFCPNSFLLLQGMLQ
jgi:hypothetical protein